MTLYLKYRPQKIADLDLDDVRENLTNIVKSGRIPHAFLFCGPRGAGKTSTARILAKVVNCDSTSPKLRGVGLIEPCNECSQCMSITRGSNMDVIEIDAASNRGVDDIRTLRETVKLAASGSFKKVYIIDEAHMLTTEAANALLKTLEEPPEHVLFILATTAPEKLPDTIRSRCTTLVFSKGTEKEIISAMQKVVDGEKFKIEDGALSEIAKIVDGSFREAHKVLEQLSFGGEIKIENVRNFNSNSEEDPKDLISLIVQNNINGALLLISKVAEKGTNLKVYNSELVGLLRKALLAEYGVGVSGNKIPELQVREIQKMIEVFTEAGRNLPTSIIPQLPLEMGVVKILSSSHSIHLSGNSPDGSDTLDVRSSNTKPSKKEELNADSPPIPLSGNLPDGAGSPDIHKLPSELTETEVISQAVVLTALENEELNKLWQEIVRLAKAKIFSIEALLRACKPISFDGKDLQIEVFYEFHKERLESQVHRTIIEQVAEEITGGKLRLVCVLSQERRRAADVLNVAETKDTDIVHAAEEIFGAPTDGKIH